MSRLVQIELRGARGLGDQVVPFFHIDPDAMATIVARSIQESAQQAASADTGEGSTAGAGFTDKYGVPLLAGGGALLLGLVIAKFSRRRRRRK